MNTPTHVAASLLVWRREIGLGSAFALLAGATLPDLPMFGFYAYQKGIGSEESEIWQHIYFQDGWQLFFDVFNSIPLAILAIVIGRVIKQHLIVLAGSSMLLHLLCDLPVHHDDSHRHFLPFSNWRFSSPISYWDPHHYGLYFSVFELVFGIFACVVVIRRSESIAMRGTAWLVGSMYLVGIVLVAAWWLNQAPAVSNH